MNFKFTLALLTLSTLSIAAPKDVTNERCKNAKGELEKGYIFVNYKQRSNPEEGGFVSYQADVDDTDDQVVIGREAVICGSSSVRESARVYGSALVMNSEIYGSARVYGNAVIKNNSEVFGEARIFDNSVVSDSKVSGKAKVRGWTKLSDDTVDAGDHNAPEFTAEELAAMAKKRADEEARRASEAASAEALRAKLVPLRAKIDKIVEEEKMIASPYSEKWISTTAGANPCVIVFTGDELTEGQGSYNLGYKIYLKKGVLSRKNIDAYAKAPFIEEFLKLNPKDSTYYKKVVTSYGSYVPAIMISGVDFSLSDTPVAGDEHNMHYNQPAQELLFTNKASRDRLFDAIEELYKACPSAK
ncbi:MAG TPA: hypothetical protein VM901_01650 [Bdellovibrionota bacterium]|jgi:carbonic anhydrase/acetyltransferase-like protein (isoleucine patch superfamily)|nr:hypothetical protein [Bdellovibrionota bacterium]